MNIVKQTEMVSKTAKIAQTVRIVSKVQKPLTSLT